jgi:MFS family permease
LADNKTYTPSPGPGLLVADAPATNSTPVAGSKDNLSGPQVMSKWLWVVYPLALTGIGSVWGSLTSVLLGRQVGALVIDPLQAAGALGATLSIGSLIGLFAQPIMGRLSDKTQLKVIGRRNFWILSGGVGGAAALLAIAASTDLVLVTVFYALAMLPLCALQAALTAVLPERIPVRLRGTMSGIVGTTGVLGAMIGIALAGLTPELFTGYVLIAIFLAVSAVLFAFSTKDAPAPISIPIVDKRLRREANRLPGLRAHSDFWWTFAGRFLVIFGYFIIAGFNLFLLRDYIKVGDGSITAAAQALVGISLVSSLLSLIFSVIGGVLSDRFGRVKVFVGFAAILMVPAAVVFVTTPTYTGFFVAQAILGCAFGMYTAVDQVLITRVLPNDRNVARDLGLINVANSGPQVLAPVIAGFLIAATADYTLLFYISIAAFILAAVTVRFIKSVP